MGNIFQRCKDDADDTPPAAAPDAPASPDETREAPPAVAIVGGGLAGCALALALRQRGVRAVVFEADATAATRPQGYALTLQQGATALRSLGVAIRGASPAGHASFRADGAPPLEELHTRSFI